MLLRAVVVGVALLVSGACAGHGQKHVNPTAAQGPLLILTAFPTAAESSGSIPPSPPNAAAPVFRGSWFSLSFVSATHGWVGRSDGIFVTHDGGQSWAKQYSGASQAELLQFTDDENGWASGCIPTPRPNGNCETHLLATYDGGARWTQLLSAQKIVSITLDKTGDGWVLTDPCQESCGVEPAQLLATRDRGVTFQLPPA